MGRTHLPGWELMLPHLGKDGKSLHLGGPQSFSSTWEREFSGITVKIRYEIIYVDELCELYRVGL